MAKVHAWFHTWWPMFAAATPILTGAILWWMSQYFVARSEHARDLIEVQRDISRIEQAVSANAAEHRQIMEKLSEIREAIAAIKAREVAGGFKFKD